MPPKQDSTQNYLREIMLGVKLYLKLNYVIVIRVPQYKGLQVKDLLRFAASKVAIKTTYLTMIIARSLTGNYCVT